MPLSEFSFGKHDEGHFVRHEVGTSEEFFAHAADVLGSTQEEVWQEVIPHLEKYKGKWHPIGFMVYFVGLNEKDGSSLRLHVWPAGLRIYGENGPNIHNHAWYLSSYVMTGEYTDTIFEPSEPEIVWDEKERIEAGLLRKYQLGYLPNGVNALVTDGSCVRAVPKEDRLVRAGDIHNMVDGVFHVPIIGEDRTVATLVLDSPGKEYETTVLLNRPPDPVTLTRIMVREEEAIHAKELLLGTRVAIEPYEEV